MATLEAKGEHKRDFKFARLLEESMPEPEPDRSPHSAIRRQEQIELIRQCIPRLRTTYRNALQGWLDEDDVAAMAEREGIEAVSMRGRIFKAKQMVKEMVADARKTPSHLR
jgi:hypothetical protein